VQKFASNIRRIGSTMALVGVLAMSLAACGETPTATPAPQPTNTVGSATDPTAMPQPTDTATGMSTDPTPTEGNMNQEVQEVKLTIKEWKIEPATVEIKPGPVRFIVTNTGQFSHNITILAGGQVLGATPTFASSESPKEIYIEDMQAGTYDMLCSLPGHASQGQRGTITVK
jgi:plastocyanin